MARFNRRRLVVGSLAGLGATLAPRVDRWGGDFARAAKADGPFDIAAGAPGCSRIALMINVGSGFDPAMEMFDTLNQYGATATVFAMGWLAEQNPGLLQGIAAWGHPIGSHGYLPPELTSRSDDDVASDLDAGVAALQSALGYDPIPWLTPYASASDDRVRAIADSLGLTMVGWSVSSDDWDPGATANSIYNNAVGGAYDGAIIELHLDSERSVDGTAVALPWILDDLSSQGYQFVTVPQIAGGC
jgi:peptidoglycan/xylan/chitin deacetylase (PgdA/CDA1 family)